MGAAIIFVLALAGAAIVSFYILAFSASALLIIVEGTAAGNDEVPWSKEPYAEVISRAIYLGSLIGLWLIPAGFIWNGLRDVFLPTNPPLRLLLIALPGLWLFFPLGLLSSLRSLSGYGFFRFDMLRDLFRVLPATLLFYGVSFLLALSVGTLWNIGLNANPWALLAAGPFTAFAWLIYARMLGRLALKIGLLKPLESDRKPEPTPEKKARSRNRDDRPRRKKSPEAEPEMGPVMPSGEESAEPVKQPRPAWLDPEPEPYVFSDEAPPERPNMVPMDGYDPVDAEGITPTAPGEDRIAATNRGLAERDRRVTRKKKAPKLPNRPMLEGIWTFPFYPQCVSPLISLAFGWLVLAGLLVLMIMNFQ